MSCINGKRDLPLSKEEVDFIVMANSFFRENGIEASYLFSSMLAERMCKEGWTAKNNRMAAILGNAYEKPRHPDKYGDNTPLKGVIRRVAD